MPTQLRKSLGNTSLAEAAQLTLMHVMITQRMNWDTTTAPIPPRKQDAHLLRGSDGFRYSGPGGEGGRPEGDQCARLCGSGRDLGHNGRSAAGCAPRAFTRLAVETTAPGGSHLTKRLSPNHTLRNQPANQASKCDGGNIFGNARLSKSSLFIPLAMKPG